jgi:hypothetical protein
MSNVRMTISMMVAGIIFLSNFTKTDAYPYYIHWDSGYHVIQNGEDSDTHFDIRNDSVLDMLGGTFRSISGWDFSTVNVSGGALTNLWGYESSTVNISGGTFSDNVDAYGNSTMNISGGNFTYDRIAATDSGMVNISGGIVSCPILATGSSTVNISGGVFSDTLYAAMSTTVYIHGKNFNLPLGEITALTGTLTGTLDSGDAIQIPFIRDEGTAVILVPEPATLLFLGLGGLIISRRKTISMLSN